MKANHFITPIIGVISLLLLLHISSCDSNTVYVEAINKNLPNTKEIRPLVNVYIENSGSMDGYMCDGSQLKDAVYDFVSDINGIADTTRLNYINKQIIPCKEDLNSYIKEMNPATFKLKGGDRTNSDIGMMIETILRNMNANSISIFVSDCILDLPVDDAQRFLNNCEISIKNSINTGKQKIENLGVLVIKMASDFNGTYFYQNGISEKLKDVKRPYYIWIFGNSYMLAKMDNEIDLMMLQKHGMQDFISFTSQVDVPFEIKNSTLASNVIISKNGRYHAAIKSNLDATLQSQSMLLDKTNYSFNNTDMQVDSIKEIKAKNSPYTHLIYISWPKDAKLNSAELRLKPIMPGWVKEANDQTGTNVKANLNKTTGIKYLIGGVADAYKRTDVLTSLLFSIKKKR